MTILLWKNDVDSTDTNSLLIIVIKINLNENKYHTNFYLTLTNILFFVLIQ